MPEITHRLGPSPSIRRASISSSRPSCADRPVNAGASAGSWAGTASARFGASLGIGVAGASRDGSPRRIACCKATSSGRGSRPNSAAEPTPGTAVLVEGVLASAGAVEGQQVKLDEAFPIEMLADQPPQLGQQVVVPAEGQVQFDAALHSGQAGLVSAWRSASRTGPSPPRAGPCQRSRAPRRTSAARSGLPSSASARASRTASSNTARSS